MQLKFDNEERSIYLEKLYGANDESVKMDEWNGCVGITDGGPGEFVKKQQCKKATRV